MVYLDLFSCMKFLNIIKFNWGNYFELSLKPELSPKSNHKRSSNSDPIPLRLKFFKVRNFQGF